MGAVVQIVVGKSGKILAADAGATDIFGKDVVGVSIDDLAGVSGHAALRASVASEESRAMGRTVRIEGKSLDIAFSPEDGEGTRHVWVIDRTAETTMIRLLELGLDLACTATDGLHFDYLSPSWERTLGWTLDELRAKPFVEFVHPDDVAATAKVAEEMLANSGEGVLFRNRYRHKSGSWVWLEWMARVTDNVFWASARDVTRQVEQEEALARQHRDLEEFSYAAAHDLKAPLRRLSSLASSAKQALSSGGAEKAGKRLEQMRAAAEDGAAIVEAALDYARSGGDLPTEIVDIEEAVDTALLVAGPMSGIRLSTGGPEGLLVQGHKASIVRVIQNFLDNARKYAAGSSVSVRWGYDEGRVFVAVTDGGRGFDPEWAERLWAPAWRGHGDVEGHGFGLAKVRRLVEAMGGEVSATSPGEDKGATFQFSLRRAE